MENQDCELWRGLVAGDERAFSSLFRKYYASLYSYGESITKHHYLVGDCIQDVFADVWIYRKSLSTPDSVKAYLLSGLRKRISRKLQRDNIFKNSTNIDQLDFIGTFTILDQLIVDEDTRFQVEHLNMLINQLTPKQREGLYLRYHQQLSVTEIADLLQMNVQSVSNLLHRALKQLRSNWKGKVTPMLILLDLLITR